MDLFLTTSAAKHYKKTRDWTVLPELNCKNIPYKNPLTIPHRCYRTPPNALE
jgi:hypothetical protein